MPDLGCWMCPTAVSAVPANVEWLKIVVVGLQGMHVGALASNIT
jgi:anaerobic glycerol-3-phosphate dehydrogenase